MFPNVDPCLECQAQSLQRERGGEGLGALREMIDFAAGIWYFPKIKVPQYRPQYIIVLIMGTTKRVPLILGNPYIFWASEFDSKTWEGGP